MPESKVAVTGAAGFIGSHVCQALLEAGYRVVGVDNFDPYYDRRIKQRSLATLDEARGFTFVECDVRRTERLRSLLTDVEIVVHLAGRPGVRPSIDDPRPYTTMNVVGTASVLEAARVADVARFVFCSSSSVYGNSPETIHREDVSADRPISPYAASKRSGELLCEKYSRQYGLTVATVRLFSVYGARQRPDLAIHRFAQAILCSERVRQFGGGGSERDYTYIDDAVSGIVAAMDWTGVCSGTHEIFNLGESRSVQLSYLIQLLGESIGIEPRVEVLPDQPGDVHRTCADISKARDVLGYRPRVSIEDGVPLFVEWYRKSNGHAEFAAS